MRIDLGRPMAKGNFILFKGPSMKGKTAMAYSTIKRFLMESEEHRAIYAGLSPNAGQKLLKELPEECRERAMAIGVDPASGETSSDADYILAPHAALHASMGQHKKYLIVFDDVLLHKFKEKHVYGLANQPFAPKNILNELME